MAELIRTDSDNPDFIQLVRLLDTDLAIRDGEDHAFYAQYNKIGTIKYVILAYEGQKAIACGALKEFEGSSAEVKRMFTLSEYRGKGIATMILTALENWAKELSFQKFVLETGIKQPEAIHLYKKNGYTITPNYGQYIGIDKSVCFEKEL